MDGKKKKKKANNPLQMPLPYNPIPDVVTEINRIILRYHPDIRCSSTVSEEITEVITSLVEAAKRDSTSYDKLPLEVKRKFCDDEILYARYTIMRSLLDNFIYKILPAIETRADKVRLDSLPHLPLINSSGEVTIPSLSCDIMISSSVWRLNFGFYEPNINIMKASFAICGYQSDRLFWSVKSAQTLTEITQIIKTYLKEVEDIVYRHGFKFELEGEQNEQ